MALTPKQKSQRCRDKKAALGLVKMKERWVTRDEKIAIEPEIDKLIAKIRNINND